MCESLKKFVAFYNLVMVMTKQTSDILVCWTAEFHCFFRCFIFSELLFSSVCCCQYELLYVLLRYFSTQISFNVLVHQVNVTEVDVSAELELWQRSISHDWSKLNICIFDVYIYIYHITCFCKILFYHFSYGYLNLLEYRYVVILPNFMLSFETVLF